MFLAVGCHQNGGKALHQQRRPACRPIPRRSSCAWCGQALHRRLGGGDSAQSGAPTERTDVELHAVLGNEAVEGLRPPALEANVQAEVGMAARTGLHVEQLGEEFQNHVMVLFPLLLRVVFTRLPWASVRRDPNLIRLLCVEAVQNQLLVVRVVDVPAVLRVELRNFRTQLTKLIAQRGVWPIDDPASTSTIFDTLALTQLVLQLFLRRGDGVHDGSALGGRQVTVGSLVLDVVFDLGVDVFSCRQHVVPQHVLGVLWDIHKTILELLAHLVHVVCQV